ncbi:1-aminocyclopropane-1-carboxylate deaminase/D-cysteine desulfhydrase [Oryzihumus leptocrescens]|uniref:D-cysteine desulfhydrase n=1 Tax=Oryzihumus leptocrescens TaxID=297536 RepID=A0A542ZL49_9MICO|nr:pyridoxal-phosphate dependent enzyme [Oryzihumus leptocrescens]TQL61074.1 D-cysteine desulfhydrase [Oryzihumus leptocrescens]
MAVTLARAGLATLPTPLVRAHRLEEALAAGPIYLKRDDLTGFGVAGNKARALEFLIGDAVARRADVLVSGGSPSSSFCAAAAMAATTAGLACDLLFSGPAPTTPAVNIALARAAGARLHFDAAPTREQLDEAVVAHSARLAAAGHRPYAVPRGGATGVGAAGYACAARELADQCAAAEISPAVVVVATGSGATQAGLVAGQVGFGLPWRVLGASVSREPDEARAQVLGVARECARLLGLAPPAATDVDLRDCRGPGFGVPSEDDRTSAAIALRHEGLLLDPGYGAKAMSLLRREIRDGTPAPVVFWHTGGVAAALSALVQGAQP